MTDQVRLKATSAGKEQSFLIEEDVAGFYVYVFDSQGRCTHDYLQDSLELAMAFVEEEFGVAHEEWSQIECPRTPMHPEEAE
jgi:hypothetical protein